MTQLSPTRPYFFKAPLVASCCQYRAFGDVENLNHSIRSGCTKRLLPYQFHTQRCFCILASVPPLFTVVQFCLHSKQVSKSQWSGKEINQIYMDCFLFSFPRQGTIQSEIPKGCLKSMRELGDLENKDLHLVLGQASLFRDKSSKSRIFLSTSVYLYYFLLYHTPLLFLVSWVAYRHLGHARMRPTLLDFPIVLG